MSFEFEKYNSLTNHYQTGQIEKTMIQGKDGGDWVAVEKIHGANFAFYYDGTTMQHARRRDFIEAGELFYGHSNMAARNNHNIKGIYMEMISQGMITKGDVVVFYGELAGGNWFGQKATAHTAKVGKGGIWYSDREEFFGFDICIKVLVGGDVYLPWSTMQELFTSFTVRTPALISYGTFTQCVNLSNSFESLTGVQGGFTVPAGETNKAEGLVIRNVSEDRRWLNDKRIIIKSVCSEHSVKSSEKTEKAPAPELPDDFQEDLDNMLARVNRNRVLSICSKEGEPTWTVIGKFIGLMIQDILEEFEGECLAGIVLRKHYGEHYRFITKALGYEVGEVLRSYLKE